jgi:tRNA A-37 threonylcarbamoyl transferase component Bud32
MLNHLFETITKKHLRSGFVRAEKVDARGMVNNVYTLHTSAGKYIVRLDLNEVTLERFNKERWCINEATRLGIPSPKVLGMGTFDRKPYMLTSFIEGIDGDLVKPEKHITIWASLGIYAKLFHGVKVEGFGERMKANGLFVDSWQEYLDYNIRSMSPQDKLQQTGVITPDESKKLKNRFKGLKEKEFQFGLIHHDLSLKNTRMGTDGKVYLLDWGSANVNIIPHMEIAEILESSLDEDSQSFKVFLKGYGMSIEKYQAIKEDMQTLLLLMKIDKIRWAMDRSPGNIEKKIFDFRKELNRNDHI